MYRDLFITWTNLYQLSGWYKAVKKSQSLVQTLTPSCFLAFLRDTGKVTYFFSVTFSLTVNDDNIPHTLNAVVKIKWDYVFKVPGIW